MSRLLFVVASTAFATLLVGRVGSVRVGQCSAIRGPARVGFRHRAVGQRFGGGERQRHARR